MTIANPNFVASIKIDSPNSYVDVTKNCRISTLNYEDTSVSFDPASPGNAILRPYKQQYVFETRLKVPKTGLMLVGLGGNNGSTLLATLTAHRHALQWRTRWGVQKPNYLGSLTLASSLRLGRGDNGSVYAPFSSFLPLVDPASMPVTGWDISSASMSEAMTRAQVLEPDLQAQLEPLIGNIIPLPGTYDPDFIAMNQGSRANNLIPGTKKQQLEKLRSDIRTFRAQHNLDQVIVLWTANTERFSQFPGQNAESLIEAIEKGNDSEVAPSVLYAVAAILENAPFINGSPQNTLIPSVVDLALQKGVLVAGDDFKSGQTKLKCVLVDFLVSAGIKPISIASYNHLGNNDGLNLSSPSQFRSKEISKSGVIEDTVASNMILYPDGKGPDHVVVIKYTPAVGDSKRALDEYESEIYCGGRQTMSIHTVCEDSLLAVPLMIDLVLLTDLLGRVQVVKPDNMQMHSVLSHLSYCLKAPLFPKSTQTVNALQSQRLALENFMRALLGLPPSTHMDLEVRLCPK
ncbi:hypothetical protein MDAP_002583 [Mitosporidium daphniae]